MIYTGCSTPIPTLEQSAKQTHIPAAFSNTKDLLTSQNTTKIKQSTNLINMESLQEQPFRLQQFMALIDDKQLHQILHLALENNTNVLSMISRI